MILKVILLLKTILIIDDNALLVDFKEPDYLINPPFEISIIIS